MNMSAKQQFKQFKQRWRETRLRWVKVLLDRTPEPSPTPSPDNIRAILFLRQDGKIGDYIVSAFALRAIKQQAPHIRIGVLCSEKNRAIFSGSPDIDVLHEVKAKSTLSYWQVGKSLAGQYDVVIDPTLSLRPRDLLLLNSLRARYNVGLDKADFQLFNSNITDKKQHFSDIYRQALLLCGFADVDTAFRLPENAESAKKAADFVAQHDLQDFVALNFFGAANSRRFDEAHIRAMLSALCATYPQEHWILLTYPEVSPMLRDIARDFAHVYLMDNTQMIQDSIELIRLAKLVISPDTAIVHIAASLQKPVIGFYPNRAQNTANWYPKTAHYEMLMFDEHIHEVLPEKVLQALGKLNQKLNLLK
ncbi:glycosyltransferase family 9 protein [Neisseriaceae bacterium B1]